MLHEDFYSSGTYVNRELGIFSAFVSSDSDRSPGLVWNDVGNIGCFISGEAFIDSSDADWLRSRGHKFPNDIRLAFVHLYQELGLAALEKLNGWFSALVVDRQRRQTVLFNDRYGLNRIYIHQQGERLFFSSEAKSLLSVVSALREFGSARPGGMV